PVFVTESVPEYAAALLLSVALLSSWRSRRTAATVAISVLLAVLVAAAGVRYLSPEWMMPQRARIAGAAVACAFIASANGTRSLAAILALAMVGGIVRLPGRETLFEARNFFGTSRVELDGDIHMLKHGTTLHGIQPTGPDAANPASYYSRASPLGHVMDY